MDMLTRREWIQATAGAAVATAVARPRAASAPTYCFFSKHLPDLNWGDVARAVRDIGFGGVDLTVRTNGHVLPAKAAVDLPRAIEAIKAQGVSVPMVTTELTNPADPNARPLLQAAARSGVRYFKTGYWHYTATGDVRAQLAAVGKDLEGLAALAREYGIELGFHNHTAYVGAALWDIAPAMDRLDPKWAGYYFDPRHAVAEGGGGAWKASTSLASTRLKMVAVKDFYWKKTEKGWVIQDCPIGEGQVDWAWMGKALHAASFAGPVSVHLEYEIPGSTAAERTKRTLDAAQKDLAFVKKAFA
jgi:L-ribulose-5-phosphate 3-epimerase